MPDSVSKAQRREIARRAEGKCEYCLTPEWILLAGCEVDHVISRKHGGNSDQSNLAFSCARCNRAKGADIGSLLEANGEFCRLFNPRVDRWEDHFFLEGSQIAGTTDIGNLGSVCIIVSSVLLFTWEGHQHRRANRLAGAF